ncbi:MAG: DUF5309 domain-containing protein [Mucispirillum sp.]|nr:DUF5309 domain-containing protein [Mucispirillum sp.]
MSVIYDTYTTNTQTELVKRSIGLRDKIFQNAKLSPLFMMLQARSRVISETNQKFEWLETRLNKPTFKVAPAGLSETSLTVVTDEDTVTFLTEGSIIKDIKTHEQMRVTAVNGKTLTVIRGYGVTSAKEIVADAGSGNATLVNISVAYPEGSTAPKGTVLLKKDNFNYCQTFRRTLKITRNKLRQGEYGDDGTTAESRRKAERNKILRLHQNDIEQSLMFGEPKKDLSGSEPLYVTGGLFHYIKTNVMSITSPDKFKVGTINEILGAMADKGSAGDKVMLTGSGFNAKLNDNAIKTFAGGSGSLLKEYGISLDKIDTEYGELNIAYDPVLSAVYPNTAVIIDLDELLLHFIEETKMDTNIQSDGYDGVVDTFLTDCGLEVSNEECHGILTLNF